jgi:hypothetical protein
MFPSLYAVFRTENIFAANMFFCSTLSEFENFLLFKRFGVFWYEWVSLKRE